jgi:DNA (cytosine-5)-methyltransferase 1
MHLQTIPPTLVDGKLNAKFVEYMMGLTNGWVTDLDLSRAQQLKMLGNGVVPQQAYYALELLHE